MPKKLPTAYSPTDFSPAEDWLICNALIGATSYIKASEPIEFNDDLRPDWYLKLEDYEDMQKVWLAQKAYVRQLFNWIESKGITDAYLDGAYEDTEAWFRTKYGIMAKGHFDWLAGIADDLPEINSRNMFVRAADGTVVLQLGTWETIFVLDPTDKLPAELRQPTITGIEP